MPHHGILTKLRLFGADGALLQSKTNVRPAAIDLQCINAGDATLTNTLAAGFPCMDIDWGEFVNGGFPRVFPRTAGTSAPTLGILHWEHLSVLDNAKCWVRIWGRHPYAAVNGTSAVAAGDMLTLDNTVDGLLIKGSAVTNMIARALEAWSTASTAGKAVFVCNPMRWPLG